MHWANNLDDPKLLQLIHEKDKIIEQKDIHIHHLAVMIEYQNAEIEDYKNCISTIEEQKIELEVKDCIIEKLNHYKDILLTELQEKIEECTRNEKEIEQLNGELGDLKFKHDSILEKYEHYNTLHDSKPFFDETVQDILSSSDYTNSKISSYNLYMKCDELADIVNKKNDDIKDLTKEVECLRNDNSRMYSEISCLRNELEVLQNESYLKIFSEPSLKRASLAFEIPELSNDIEHMFSDEKEIYISKIAELESKLLESNQKLQEAIKKMKSHHCQVICVDEIGEDVTQTMTDDNTNENNLIYLQKIKETHEEEINALKEKIEFLKAKLLSCDKKISGKSPDEKTTLTVINPLIILIDYILSKIRAFFDKFI